MKFTAVYQANVLYPHDIIETHYPGFMREHYLMTVQVNVAQYNPVAKKIKINKRIKFKLEQVIENKNIKNKSEDIYHSLSEREYLFDIIISKSILNREKMHPNDHFQQKTARKDSLYNPNSVNFYRQICGIESYKISINEDGMYKLDYSYLRDARLNLFSINPLKIHIYNKGDEIPIYVHGEQDSVFDESDYIVFYGYKNETMYSNDNVYWLVLSNEKGLRMSVKNGKPGSYFDPIKNYIEHTHIEENVIYKSYMPDRGDDDCWTWDEIKVGEKKDFRFHISDIAGMDGDNAAINIMLYGMKYADHNVQFYLNGNEIHDISWKPKGNYWIKTEFSQLNLLNGRNTLSIKAQGVNDNSNVFFDWFELNYWRKFDAKNGTLGFCLQQGGVQDIQVKNFTTDKINLFEIENEHSIYRILNSSIEQRDGNFDLLFTLNFVKSNRYICIESDSYLTPRNIEMDEPSYLHLNEQQSDYIIITHGLFFNSILPLAERHKNNGLAVSVVNVSDIYDEFNYGIFSPEAIKDFLSYSYYFWNKPSPVYVLLVGDASYDYKDFLGKGDQNFVPTYLFRPIFSGESASDNWFVCVSGDDNIPDMQIGRLPVKSVDELSVVVEKIIEYTNDFKIDNWKKNVLLMCDNPTYPEKFEIMSDSLANIIPDGYNITKMYVSRSEDKQEMRDCVIHELNSGCLIANYIGHGAIEYLAWEQILGINTLPSLYNYTKLPFFTAFTCSSGMFQHPEKECLAEGLLKAQNGGAIAVFTSTGTIQIHPDNPLGNDLYTSVFVDENYTIGSAILQAKLNYLTHRITYEGNLEMFTLFGDPALKLNTINPEAPIVHINYHDNLLIANQYVEKYPQFIIKFETTSPLNWQSIRIELDKNKVDQDICEIYSMNEEDYIQIQTQLEYGIHTLKVSAVDSAGLGGENEISFIITEDELSILNILNYPNPFYDTTAFTYELSRPAEVTIKIYTVAGRLIKIINDYSMKQFNYIEWDGCDDDGDRIANGVYFYKVIANDGNNKLTSVEKFAKIK
ncbi:T9SS type A sorting domain-containing protein [candidate division KSB1 bacterium]|nr:T9SS type A sorting domain-containing protein [candidate division KSB1 bacterium]